MRAFMKKSKEAALALSEKIALPDSKGGGEENPETLQPPRQQPAPAPVRPASLPEAKTAMAAKSATPAPAPTRTRATSKGKTATSQPVIPAESEVNSPKKFKLDNDPVTRATRSLSRSKPSFSSTDEEVDLFLHGVHSAIPIKERRKVRAKSLILKAPPLQDEAEKLLKKLHRLSNSSKNLDDGGSHVHGSSLQVATPWKRRSPSVRRANRGPPPPPPAFRGGEEKELATASKKQKEAELVARWETILGQGGNLSGQEEVVELVELGVPASIRAKVWYVLSGGKEQAGRYPPNYFRQLLAVYVARGGSQADYEIKKDIMRTLPEAELFKTQSGRDSLTRVLSAYCLRNPDSVGYCQSMNQLAGALLTVIKDEEMTFWVLVCMIESRIGYYCQSMCGLEVDMRVMSSLLKFQLPALHKHLQECSCPISSFAYSWFLCLCVESPVPIASVPLFWDKLFMYGDEMLHSLTLALLAEKQAAIMSNADPGDLLVFLLHGGIRRDVDWESLLKSIQVGKVCIVEKIAQLRQFHQAEVVRQSSLLNIATATKLTRQFGFEDAEQVQKLWVKFLDPSPWPTLLTSCLKSHVALNQALNHVFPADQRERWRDEGLLSGVMQRLFELLDVNDHGKVSFEMFLRAAQTFLAGSQAARCKLAFRFFDVENRGVVTRDNLKLGFYEFQLMYDGNDGNAEEMATLFVDMILSKVAEGAGADRGEDEGEDEGEEGDTFGGFGNFNLTTRQRDANGLVRARDSSRPQCGLEGECEMVGLDHSTFTHYIGLHPFVQMFFGLEAFSIHA